MQTLKRDVMKTWKTYGTALYILRFDSRTVDFS